MIPDFPFADYVEVCVWFLPAKAIHPHDAPADFADEKPALAGHSGKDQSCGTDSIEAPLAPVGNGLVVTCPRGRGGFNEFLPGRRSNETAYPGKPRGPAAGDGARQARLPHRSTPGEPPRRAPQREMRGRRHHTAPCPGGRGVCGSVPAKPQGPATAWPSNSARAQALRLLTPSGSPEEPPLPNSSLGPSRQRSPR